MAGRRRSALRRTVRDVPLHDPTRTGVMLATVNVVLYAIMSLAVWAGWGGLYRASRSGVDAAVNEAVAVTGVNLLYGLLVVGGTLLLRPRRWPPRIRYSLIALVALVASLPRSLAMVAIYSTPGHTTYVFAEWVAGFLGGFVAVAAGVLAAELVSRARREESRRMRAARKAAKAVAELNSEEVRVRRMVADRLHGTLQYQLVTVTAGLDCLAAQLDAGTTPGPEAAANLRDWAERLEQIREEEVRSLSHAVFPAGVELGTVRAVEMMLHRLPPQIEAHLDVGAELRRAVEAVERPLPTAERLIAVYAIEEGITNALRHGQAKRLWISMEMCPTDEQFAWVLEITIDDDGVGLAQPDPELSGLSRHADRLETYGGSLELTPGPRGGARLHLRVPFNRRLDCEMRDAAESPA